MLNSTNRSINLWSTFRGGRGKRNADLEDFNDKKVAYGGDVSPKKSVPPPTNPTESPEDNAFWLSLATWEWLSPLLFLGHKRPLELEDVYPLPKDYRSEALSVKFEAAWKQELERWTKVETVDPITGKIRVKWKPKEGTRHPAWFFGLLKHTEPSVLSACSRVYWKPFALAGLMRGISDTTQVANPILLNFLINYIIAAGSGQNTYSVGYGLGFLFGIFGLMVINAFTMHGNWWWGSKAGFATSRSLITAVYAKSLRLSQGARQKYFSGKTVNMMASDTARIGRLEFVEETASLGLL